LQPFSKTQHIFNGSIADPYNGTCAEIHASCNWDPFLELETPTFFHTYITESDTHYTIHVALPCYISRFIRVEKGKRRLAIIGKAMARRQWRDFAKKRDNVHEQWKTYWRLFCVPLHADISRITAEYEEETVRVVIPRRTTLLYRIVNKAEAWMWTSR
ncbi:hypothetical protein GGI12_005807, partial [Dipsacomyces acuminosporus]